MLVARTTIETANRVYKEGETVQGLSQLDREWMKAAGYLAEVPEPESNPEAEVPEPESNLEAEKPEPAAGKKKKAGKPEEKQ